LGRVGLVSSGGYNDGGGSHGGGKVVIESAAGVAAVIRRAFPLKANFVAKDARDESSQGAKTGRSGKLATVRQHDGKKHRDIGAERDGLRRGRSRLPAPCDGLRPRQAIGAQSAKKTGPGQIAQDSGSQALVSNDLQGLDPKGF